MNGYTGKLLMIDLTTRDFHDEPLNEKYAKLFIGGAGLACRYLYDMIGYRTEPLGPDNVLVFMDGLINGTSAPSASRWSVVARSPLTGIYGEANCGGFFGAELRFSGYDGIIIKGRSPSPVYINIKEENIEIRDAGHIWGQDTYQTIDGLKKECADERTRLVCIGPAGEKLVSYAAIMTEKGRTAGRTGLGAVMGSKNLKAIAVRGKRKWPMADAEKFRTTALQSTKSLQDVFTAQVLHELGTSSWVDTGIDFGDTPNKYYTQGVFSDAASMSGSTMSETILTGQSGCFGCPIRCGRVVHVKNGKYALSEGHGPEYETIAAWGAMLLISDLPAINYINHLCTAYGIDTISSGVSAAFAFYLYDQGVITAKDTGGLELRWGDIDAAIALLNQIGKKERFGAIVAEGVKRMGERYGLPDDAAHVKGLEIPMHDPRAFAATALAYTTSPRGACHNKDDAWAAGFGMSNPDIGIVPGDRFGDDKANMVTTNQNWRAFGDSLGLCHYALVPVPELLDIINTSTGWNMDFDGIMRTGERIFQLQRAMGCRLGVTAADDRLPSIIMTPLSDGGTEGHVPNVEKMLSEYYALRGWDTATGKPSRERLISLGLADIAEYLWKT
jgi:aldehyde:ferredoxin oxidoreductase